jgi:crotonobetainyl-CoA:carnitine CoA-transferase CaiB-like acyl-CoA transferase
MVREATHPGANVPGPLHGVRVLELSSVVLGPWACQLLGDLGADVVKVEPPDGDIMRVPGPSRHPGMGHVYLNANRNKRGIVLDLKQEAGRRAALDLAAVSDVLVHNFRPAALARLQLDYAHVRDRNPRIVFCGTHGFASAGPNRDEAAYDDSIQAASGLAMFQGVLAGEPGFIPTIICDKTTAMAVVSAVTAALFHRERTGEGQEVEVPMFETMVGYLAAEHLQGRIFDPPVGQAGYRRVLSRYRRPYRTRDGYLAVLPYLDEHWRVFCALAGRPDLADDPRYARLADRSARIDDVYAETERIVATRTTAEWVEGLRRTTVPFTVVRSYDDLFEDEHLRATGYWRVMEHPTEGRLRLPGVPSTFSASPGSIRRLPPRLGEHSLEVLEELGYSGEHIARMLASGATVQAS